MYLQGQGAVQTQLDKTWDLINCLNFGLGPASTQCQEGLRSRAVGLI